MLQLASIGGAIERLDSVRVPQGSAVGHVKC